MYDPSARNATQASEGREGDLYKVVRVCGISFPLYYGYYEEIDRINPLSKPIPIYPDLSRDVHYTPQGEPIVTMMQDACKHFAGGAHADDSCGDCEHFGRCEELFGVCRCSARQKRATDR